MIYNQSGSDKFGWHELWILPLLVILFIPLTLIELLYRASQMTAITNLAIVLAPIWIMGLAVVIKDLY